METVPVIEETFEKGWEMDITGLLSPPKGEEGTPPPVEAKEEGEIKSQPEEKEEKPIAKEEKPVEAKVDDFEQKWKSVQGIVKHKDGKIAELEQELERIKTAKPVEPKTEDDDGEDTDPLDELEAKYIEAISDGDTDTARKIRKEKESLLFDRLITAAEERVTSNLSKKDTEAMVSKVATEAYKEFPFLNHEDESVANPQAIRLVRATATDYMEAGMNKVDAIAKAVAEVGPIFKSMVSMPAIPKEESKINEDELKRMAAVKKNTAPIKPEQKISGGGSFSDGWKKAD